MFLENAIAMAGSDLSNSCNLNSDTKFVIVMDNENRNREIVKKIEGFIKRGYSVCIWDEKIQQKDKNDVQASIVANTFEGLQATLALNNWKRV